MLVFAYDGSLNGDWLAHYAVRFAANTPERTLRLVHVSGAVPAPDLEASFARIRAECGALGVVLETEIATVRGRDVAGRLLEIVPPRATVVAGLRARARHRAYLAGTVSARLIEARRCSVIAMRVVHPGVLGQPGTVLLPIAGRPRQSALALPFLRLLGADLQRLHVLFVRELSGVRLRNLSHERAEALLVEGRARVTPIEAELREGLAPLRFELGSSVTVSDDPVNEILLWAGRLRARLIGLGASERTALERVLFGNPIEQLLRDAPSDVAIYRAAE